MHSKIAWRSTQHLSPSPSQHILPQNINHNHSDPHSHSHSHLSTSNIPSLQKINTSNTNTSINYNNQNINNSSNSSNVSNSVRREANGNGYVVQRQNVESGGLKFQTKGFIWDFDPLYILKNNP